MLTNLQVQRVCYAGGNGPICKYLDSRYDKKLGMVHVCTKLTPKAAASLQKQRGGGSGYYSGDYCSGYPLLITPKQGYDVP